MAKQVQYTSLGILLVWIIVLVLLGQYRSSQPVPIIVDTHVINLDRATKRWNALQFQLKQLRPIPVHRWKATDGHALSEEQMKQLNIPDSELPSNPRIEEGLKQRRKGEIGCWLSHTQLLRYLSTLPVSPDAGHLILEDDVVIDLNTLDIWRSIAPHLPEDWGMFYLGAGGDQLKISNIQHGFGTLEQGWGAYGYVVRHSMIPTILSKCETMTDPIDLVYQQNYPNFKAYCLIQHTIHPKGDIQDSTIWNGHTK